MNDRPEEQHGDGEEPHLVVPHRGRLARRLRNYFLTGIVVIGPIGLTIWLTLQIVGLIDNTVRALVPARYENLLSSGIPGLGVVISVVGLMLVGFITANFLGRTLIGYGEQLVDRMPVVRSIYGALKQIFETVLAQSSTSFREVVLVEYPRKGLWAMGFVTGETKGEVQELTEADVVNIFLPTTPNPTSGFLLFVPRRDLVSLQMTVEEGIKLVISGGLVTPPKPGTAEAEKRKRPLVAALRNGPRRRRKEKVGAQPEPK
ncbi:MAG: DUF502 domain-containing protein [Proteobacteria bacterium]|nr:DUF502 domain-containing protein [Pseudomonadota bacterium]